MFAASKTAGAAAAAAVNYIEECFSTFLYTGNGTSQTITNGIDLSTKGGLVWTKCRNNAANNALFDTARGTTKYLSSNLTNAQSTEANGITAFGTTGYTFGNNYDLNESTFTYASWTFRKQKKFFDVVTYTGDGVQGRQINHALGSTPGCIIIKCTSTTSNWTVYHRSLTTNYILQLNSTTSAINVGSPNAYVSAPTDTTFTVGNDSDVNANGATYVAYLFAHDAGGFGLTGTDNVISCGSYTGNASGNGPEITLGYEPQWVMIKNASGTGNWHIFDAMRGMSVAYNNATPEDAYLRANTSDAEVAFNNIRPTQTGFAIEYATGTQTNGSGSTYIYIAIRRGPMKVPTSGTSVFNPDYSYNTSTSIYGWLGQPADLSFARQKNIVTDTYVRDRLRGDGYLNTNLTAAETAGPGINFWDNMFGYYTPASPGTPNTNYITWNMRRAPSFFDEVCYTGTGNVGSDATRITHNLGVAPELIIVKSRSNAYDWITYTANNGVNKFLLVNTTDALSTISGIWATTAPSSTTFGVSNGGGSYNNGAGMTYVAYLFATCAGVSKVGTFSHLNGTATDVDCGFTSGARFILFKRYDDVGGWYVYDSARGIVSGNDPYLLLNSTAAEVTNTDYVDPLSSGFQVSSSFGTAGDRGFYIFLAIA